MVAGVYFYTVMWGHTVYILGTIEPGGVCGVDSVAGGALPSAPARGVGDVRCGVLQEKR